MNKLVYLFGFVLLLSTSCFTETCKNTAVDEVMINFFVIANVLDWDDPEPDYPVRYTIQKFFCDGDFGLQISEDGFTDEEGVYVGSREWPIPYTNELDYVMVSIYYGTGENEIADHLKYEYKDILGGPSDGLMVVRRYCSLSGI